VVDLVYGSAWMWGPSGSGVVLVDRVYGEVGWRFWGRRRGHLPVSVMMGWSPHVFDQNVTGSIIVSH
jgi:hypothetical protein